MPRKLTTLDGISLPPVNYQGIKTIIDWRHVIRGFLGLPSECTDEEVIKGLQTTTDKLKEAERFRLHPEAAREPPRSQVIHTIRCDSSDETAMYLGDPWIVQAGPHDAHLRGSQHVANLELYLVRHKEVNFLVHREYQCCAAQPPSIDRSRPQKGLSVDLAPMITREYLSIVSPQLKYALIELSKNALKGIPHPEFEDDEDDLDISYPYLWWYHRRHAISNATMALNEAYREHLNVLRDYFTNRMSDEWAEVDDLLSRSKINAQYLIYLYVSSRERNTHNSTDLLRSLGKFSFQK